MENDGSETTNGSRRQFIVRAFTYLSALSVGSRLTTDPLLKFLRTDRIQRAATAELPDLGRAFLLGESASFSAVLGGGVIRPDEIRPAARDTMTSVIEQLKLDNTIVEVGQLDTETLQGDSLSVGGPVNSEFGLALLGTGGVSPLFEIVEAAERAKPPVSFEITSDEQTASRRRWPLIVRDRGQEQRYEGESEFLLITSIPDPYQADARLSNVATRFDFPRALDPVLTDPFLLERLIRRTRGLEGWQTLIEVTERRELGQERIFPINIDFDKLRTLLKGKPHLSDPRFSQTSALLGLVWPHRIHVSTIRPAVAWTPEWRQTADIRNLSKTPLVAERGLVPEQTRGTQLGGSGSGGRTESSSKEEITMSEPELNSESNDAEASKKWKVPITAYRPEELVGMRFADREELYRAIDLCWDEPELDDLPRSTPDGVTMIVPRGAVHIFERQGLRFEPVDVAGMSSLDNEERIQLRRRFGM